MYGKTFTSSEAAYQYKKATEHKDFKKAKQIQKTTYAVDAKHLAQDINLHPS